MKYITYVFRIYKIMNYSDFINLVSRGGNGDDDILEIKSISQDDADKIVGGDSIEEVIDNVNQNDINEFSDEFAKYIGAEALDDSDYIDDPKNSEKQENLENLEKLDDSDLQKSSDQYKRNDNIDSVNLENLDDSPITGNEELFEQLDDDPSDIKFEEPELLLDDDPSMLQTEEPLEILDSDSDKDLSKNETKNEEEILNKINNTVKNINKFL